MTQIVTKQESVAVASIMAEYNNNPHIQRINELEELLGQALKHIKFAKAPELYTRIEQVLCSG